MRICMYSRGYGGRVDDGMKLGGVDDFNVGSCSVTTTYIKHVLHVHFTSSQ